MDCKFSSSWGGWCSNEVYKLYVVRLWKNVEGLWVFSTHTKFEVENGSKIRFFYLHEKNGKRKLNHCR